MADPFEEMKKMFQKMVDEGFTVTNLGGVKSVDVDETDEDVIVKAHLPQFKKDEISVMATDRTIEITAQHKEKKEMHKKGMYRAESEFGEFRKFTTLPAEVDYQKADSKFENGILTVRLPKKEKKKAGKEIKVM